MLGLCLFVSSLVLSVSGELIEQPLQLQPEAQRAQDGFVPEHTSGYFKVRGPAAALQVRLNTSSAVPDHHWLFGS